MKPEEQLLILFILSCCYFSISINTLLLPFSLYNSAFYHRFYFNIPVIELNNLFRDLPCSASSLAPH